MKNSKALFEKAQQVITGGVNSPVRAFNGVGGTPIFFDAGKGAYLYDVDGKRYVDYVGSWGPMILGHAHPEVLACVTDAASKGLSFGAPTALEVALAEKIITLMPNIDKVRMVNSGTEATMTAIRLARAATSRNKILKFVGNYHGHHDALLVQAGSGVLTLGLPSSPGVPEAVVTDTLTANYNDVEAVQAIFEAHGKEIAAVIVEPVAGNMGCVLPTPEFLPALRTLCDASGALLILDEVMTGFRVALGGAQSVFNVRSDLTTLGKVIGGGMPVGAIGGRDDLMSLLAPAGSVYQAGTLSGNPVAMAAGLKTLELIEKPGFYEALASKTKTLTDGMMVRAKKYGIPLTTTAIGGMFGFSFIDLPKLSSFDDVASANMDLFKAFYHQMLEKGVYFAPSAFEAGFVSSAHTEEALVFTLDMIDSVFANLSC